MKIKLHIYILFSSFLLSVSSFASTDSSKTVISSWSLSDNGDILKQEIDTNILNFQIFNPIQQSSILPASLIPMGAVSMSNSLGGIFSKYDINFLKQRELFIYDNNRPFFNTKKPFTELRFFTGSKEQNLHIFHTQNINPSLNFGIEYDVISSEGFYQNQSNNNKSISLFLDYVSPKYSVYVRYAYNKYLQNENGGLKTDTGDVSSGISSTYLDVNLLSAQSESKYSNFFLGQEFNFGKKKDSLAISPFRFFHSLSYSKAYRKYDDENIFSGFYLGEFTDSLRLDSIGILNNAVIYDSVLVSFVDSNSVPLYFDSIATHDSIFNRKITNTFLFKTNISKLFQANIGITNDILLYSLIDRDSITLFDTNTIVFNRYIDTVFSSSAIIAEFYNNSNEKLKWNIGFKYYFQGYKESNMDIKLGFRSIFNTDKPDRISFIDLDAKFSRQEPNYFENNYHSNHYSWDSSFVNKDITRIKLLYNKPNWKLSFGISAYIFDNYIYYDEMSLPRQLTSTFDVYSAFIKKNLRFHHFNFNNEVIYQSNENEYVLRIPSLLYKNSTFFNFRMFNKVLSINLGFDFYYTSEYNSYAYNPATSVFYLQNTAKTGNYPLVDLFFVAKLKRAKFFVKLSHANFNLYNSETFYPVDKYPIYERALYFGLSWKFYD